MVCVWADFKSRDVCHVLPLLFPCSSLRRDILPSILKEAGLILEEVPSYVPQPHPGIATSIQKFADGLPGGDVVCVVFFSPSGIQFALHELLEICADRLTLKVRRFFHRASITWDPSLYYFKGSFTTTLFQGVLSHYIISRGPFTTKLFQGVLSLLNYFRGSFHY